MARVLILVLIVLPILEIAVLVQVGQSIGLLATLGVLLGAGLLGAWLLRQQGLGALQRLRATVSAGQMPARAIADAMMIGIAGVFLVLPGLLSDIAAIALLLPPVRALIYSALARRAVVLRPGRTPARRQGTIELDPDDYRQR